ncbi:MAG: HisA/HisF-related TIM barrel protein, partial [Desulfovibrionaceae bacterium]|nr:HisA/HisF-related TIM barrel protein [Desulfovibrionaceae bacterium]
MLVLPAVDIKDGACVRLRQGRANETTVFSPDPVAAAVAWEKQGARYLHVIDLDGAFDGSPRNRKLVEDICSALQIPVELGGGIRSMDVARAYLESGVTRLLIGTAAIEDPDLLARLCEAFPGRIGVSLDAEKGVLKTKGWTEDSGVRAVDAIPRLIEVGTAFIVYTDIERDGMQQGVNLAEMEAICRIST